MSSSGDALQTLTTVIKNTLSLISQLETVVSGIASQKYDPAATSAASETLSTITNPPLDVLSLASTSASLIKAHATKISLLIINAPFTPPPSPPSSASSSPAPSPAWPPPSRHARPRATRAAYSGTWPCARAACSRTRELVSRIPTDGEVLSDARKNASAGAVAFGKRGFAGNLACRVEQLRDTLKDVMEELKEWGEEEDDEEEDDEEENESDGEDDEVAVVTAGMGSTSISGERDAQDILDDFMNSQQHIPRDDPEKIRERLESCLKRIRLTTLLYQAIVKRRLKSLPHLPPAAESDIPSRVDEVFSLLKGIPDRFESLAMAFYELDRAEIDKLMDECFFDAFAVSELLLKPWEGQKDEFTDWALRFQRGCVLAVGLAVSKLDQNFRRSLSGVSRKIPERKNEENIELQPISRNASVSSGHTVMPPGASGDVVEVTPRLRRSKRYSRGDMLSMCSVETQIYSPLGDNTNLPVDRPHRQSFTPSLLPTSEIPDRPKTPNPYSNLRKISEASLPPNEDGSNSGDEKGSTTHRQLTTNTPQDSAPRERSSKILVVDLKDKDVDDGSYTEVKGKGVDYSSYTDVNGNGVNDGPNSPTTREDESGLLSRLRPLYRRISMKSEPARTPITGVSNVSSANAVYGESEAGPSTGISQTFADPLTGTDAVEAAGITPADDVINDSLRNSIFLRRFPSVQSYMPDISEIRRGPVLRVNRLPPSQTAATAAGRGLSRETREMWNLLPRTRNLLIVWAVFFEVSLLNAVSSITTIIVCRVLQRSPSPGVVAWTVTGSVFVATFGVLFAVTMQQYRKLDREIASSEEWIEMHLRSRPLPARPGSDDEAKHEGAATDEWHKFSLDNQQVRKYVELLENRVRDLEETQKKLEAATQSTAIGQAVTADSAPGAADTDSDKTIKPPRPNKRLSTKHSSVSLARQTLLQADNSANDGRPSSSWADHTTTTTTTNPTTNLKPPTFTIGSSSSSSSLTATECYSPLADATTSSQRGSLIYTPQKSPLSNIYSGDSSGGNIHSSGINRSGGSSSHSSSNHSSSSNITSEGTGSGGGSISAWHRNSAAATPRSHHGYTTVHVYGLAGGNGTPGSAGVATPLRRHLTVPARALVQERSGGGE
ncbi:hypothetical protein N0V88_007767 [Collariella sp. IMI 366227]|nr:hypothetical protein N0V88_007767 [Collariella sp. IMI 366227]